MSLSTSMKEAVKSLSIPKVGDGLNTCLRCGRPFGTKNRLRPAVQKSRTGMCSKCCNVIRLKKHGTKEGPRGSLINYDDRDPENPKRPMVKCGRCGEWRYRFLQNWKGHCFRCHKHKSRITGEYIHEPSGASYYRDERDPSNTNKLAFKCADCGRREFNGKKFFVYSILTKKNTWRGLCPYCLKKQGHLRKITSDKEKNGTRFLFSQPNEEGRVLMIYALCKCEVWTGRDYALEMYKSPEAPVVCRKHTKKYLLSLNGAGDGSGRAAGAGEKRRPGRTPKPPEVKQAELEQRKAEFENKIRELGQRLPQYQITRATIADEYADNDGEIPEESTIGKWVRNFYGKSVSVPAAVSQILAGSRINTGFERENKSTDLNSRSEKINP